MVSGTESTLVSTTQQCLTWCRKAGAAAYTCVYRKHQKRGHPYCTPDRTWNLSIKCQADILFWMSMKGDGGCETALEQCLFCDWRLQPATPGSVQRKDPFLYAREIWGLQAQKSGFDNGPWNSVSALSSNNTRTRCIVRSIPAYAR